MDKRFLRKLNREKLFSGARFFLNTLFGVFCIFLGIYITASLAKSGSDLFYYAMAFASPGTAIEFLHEPVFLEEPKTEVFIPEEEVYEWKDSAVRV